MQDYKEFKSILEDNKKELLSTITNSEFIQKSVSNELSLYDNHPADIGTEMEDKEKELALSSHNKEELRKVENALKAIDEGTYGKCKECGSEIPIERLEAIPSTLFCIKHTDEKIIAEDRPNEEIILRDLFNSKYDTNNSFNEVASFGTSETPSDFKDSADHYDELYNPEFES